MLSTKDKMQVAINEMYKADKKLEVPVGACIFKDDKLIAKGHNKKEGKQNALLHAEIIAINKACKRLKSWRLDECEMYVTLEPCPMCAGAIISARLNKLFIGARDEKFGAVLSNYQICTDNRIAKPVETFMLDDCEKEIKDCLKNFFKKLRNKK